MRRCEMLELRAGRPGDSENTELSRTATLLCRSRTSEPTPQASVARMKRSATRALPGFHRIASEQLDRLLLDLGPIAGGVPLGDNRRGETHAWDACSPVCR